MLLLSLCSHLNIPFIPAHIHKWLSNVFLGEFSIVFTEPQIVLAVRRISFALMKPAFIVKSMAPLALTYVMFYINAESDIQHFKQFGPI